MSSTSTTEFYGLTQYVGSDKPSFTDNNEAFRNVDADLHAAKAGVEEHAETLTEMAETITELSGNVTNLSNDLDTEKAKITALQNKEQLQDAAIEDVRSDCEDMIVAYNEAAATSTHAYSVGDYFIYNDVFYKATASIAIGDTIVPNTNCEATNVATELDATKTVVEGKQDATDNSLETTDKTVVGAINEVNTALTDKADISSLDATNNKILFNRDSDLSALSNCWNNNGIRTGTAYKNTASDFPTALSATNGFAYVYSISVAAGNGIQLAVGGDDGKTVIRSLTNNSWTNWVTLG